ncbi:sulfotransferase [Paraburkholderia caribensis]|uniref:NodH sulfotransferase n=2 Tax=Paraburkholderia TaxID=1822464 RepID=B2JY96_PARP8|nr:MULTISPECIES: sulfotransferase [Paraburkholderia]ACC76604.1 NodH sulfotransferase [Paraburkholderia phymatum STM815]MCO4880431.1 sulfotransferase [Paraburkholderia caribensis]PTB25820.1 nodulation protein NodH [Paraburkholderia caribensis]
MTHPMLIINPFVILGMPRTGTHYLEELLNEHPNVSSNGELLNPYDAIWHNRKRLLLTDHELLELAYLHYPARAGKNAITHVGCKINQPQLQERPGFFDELARWPYLKVMLVIRRNTLESLRSFMQARQSGQWLKFGAGNDSGPPPQVTLKIKDCEDYLKAADDFHRLVMDSFAPANILTVEYESLLDNPASCLQAVWSFLEIFVRPYSGSTALQRQEVRPLEQTVLNFEELKRHFAGGQYESFFEGGKIDV